jgi:hypothetical protein
MLHFPPRANPLSIIFKNNKKPLTFQFYSIKVLDWELSCEKPSHFGQERYAPFYVGSVLSLPYHDHFFIDFIIISKGALKQSI